MSTDEPPLEGLSEVTPDPCSTDNLLGASRPPPDPDPDATAEPSEEAQRLGGRDPLPTLVVLSVGPLISQITGALYPIVNTVWVAQTLGDPGITAISTYLNFDAISRGFAFFLQVGASSRISQLVGANTGSEANQVFSDLLRFAIICEGLIACFLPLAPVTARWFGADPDIVALGYQYISPNLLGGIVPTMFLLCCGALQAEGRSWLFMGVQICSMILNMLVFSPFFLFVCKTGISGVSYSGLAADFVPGVVLLVLFYRGKFTVKPELSGLLKKPSPETWPAMKVGFSQLVYQLSLAIPGALVRKYMGMSAPDQQTFNDALAGFNVGCRFWTLTLCVTNAICIGFLPAASFAGGAKRFRRVLVLLMHATWISIAWSLLSMALTLGMPKLLCRLFTSSPGVIDWGVQIMRTANIVAFVLPIPLIANALLQALQLGGTSTAFCVATQTLPLPIVSTAIFYTDKDNLERLFWSYPAQYLVSFCVAIPFAIYGVRKIWNRPDDVDLAPIPLSDLDDEKKEHLIGDTSDI
jgi:Na+-driven multidrug efflux pump